MVDTTSTHTLRFKSDAAGMVAGLNKLDKEFADVARQMDRVQAASGKAAAGVEKIGRAAAGTGRNTRLMRNQVQNLGFQVADIGVQLEMGTSLLRTFSQQGSQMLAVFGPGGAIAGAAVAIGAMALKFLWARNEVKGLSAALKESTERTVEMAKEADKIRLGEGTELDRVRVGLLIERAKLEKEISKQYVYQGRLQAENQTNAQVSLAAIDRQLKSVRERVAEEEKITAELQRANDIYKDTLGTAEGLAEATRQNYIALEKAEAEAQKHKEAVDATVDAERLLGEQLMVVLGNAALVTLEMQRTRDAAMDAAREFTTMQGLRSRFAGEDEVMGQVVQGKLGKGPAEPKKSRGGGGGGDKEPDYLKYIERGIENWQKLNDEMDIGIKLQDAWASNQELTADLVDTGLTAGVQGFTDALFEADQSFSEFAQNFLKDIGKMNTQQILLNAISRGFGGIFGDGAAFSGGSVVPFAKGGVVSSPTLFPMSGGNTGMMGEAGPEAIVPLKRGSDGSLGVGAPRIQINNYGSSPVEVTRSDDEIIEIAVGRVRSEYVASMAQGSGVYSRALESGYSARRKAK